MITIPIIFYSNKEGFCKDCHEGEFNRLGCFENIGYEKKDEADVMNNELGREDNKVFLVPYSRKSVTQFSPHALRGIKNKKSGGYYKIRMLK